PKDGGGPVEVIYTGSAVGEPITDGGAIAADGATLFTADENHGRVHRLNPDGTGITHLGPDRYQGNQRHNWVAAGRGEVFVCDAGWPGVNRPQVVRIKTSGGLFNRLHEGPPFASPRAVAAGGDTVFVADPGAGTIWTLPMTGGAPKQLIRDPRLKSVSGIVYHGNALYAVSLEGAVYAVALAGTGFVP